MSNEAPKVEKAEHPRYPTPKLNSSFKIAREIKGASTLILDPHERGDFLRLMCAAQLHAEEHAKRSRKSRKEREEEKAAEEAAAE